MNSGKIPSCGVIRYEHKDKRIVYTVCDVIRIVVSFKVSPEVITSIIRIICYLHFHSLADRIKTPPSLATALDLNDMCNEPGIPRLPTNIAPIAGL